MAHLSYLSHEITLNSEKLAIHGLDRFLSSMCRTVPIWLTLAWTASPLYSTVVPSFSLIRTFTVSPYHGCQVLPPDITTRKAFSHVLIESCLLNRGEILPANVRVEQVRKLLDFVLRYHRMITGCSGKSSSQPYSSWSHVP